MYVAKKTKIYTAALGLLMAVALVSGGCGAVGLADYLTYENSEEGIKLRYPPDWTNIGPLGESIAYFETTGGETVDPTVSLSVTIGREKSYTLETLTQDRLARFRAYSQTGGGSIESFEATLGGIDAYRVNYTLLSTFVSVWTVVDGVAYELDFIVKKGSYADLEETIQTVIDSFEFISP